MGFVLGLAATATANVAPYLLSYRAYTGDRFEHAGIPFTFFSQGGFVYRRTVNYQALAVDAGIALTIALFIGAICATRRRFGGAHATRP